MATREEVYAKFGMTAEAAQLFETELGTIVLALEGARQGWHMEPDTAKAAEFYEKLNKKTLGQILKSAREYVDFEKNVDEAFDAALDARNRLNHGFFERYGLGIMTEPGRQAMMDDLERMHTILVAAYEIAQPISSFLVGSLISAKEAFKKDAST